MNHWKKQKNIKQANRTVKEGMIMGKKNKKKNKSQKMKNPALRRFLMTLKVSLLVILSVVLVGGIVFYFTYGKDILAMQATAKREVQASTIDTFRQSETSVIYDTKGNHRAAR